MAFNRTPLPELFMEVSIDGINDFRVSTKPHEKRL
jgi:hypothetical protein